MRASDGRRTLRARRETAGKKCHPIPDAGVAEAHPSREGTMRSPQSRRPEREREAGIASSAAANPPWQRIADLEYQVIGGERLYFSLVFWDRRVESRGRLARYINSPHSTPQSQKNYASLNIRAGHRDMSSPDIAAQSGVHRLLFPLKR
jgi:hypothetical protein